MTRKPDTISRTDSASSGGSRLLLTLAVAHFRGILRRRASGEGIGAAEAPYSSSMDLTNLSRWRRAETVCKYDSYPWGLRCMLPRTLISWEGLTS
jgi:hypothetical protein